MQECPNCHEMLGNNVDVCFNCHYDFKKKRVIQPEELRKIKEDEQKRIDEINETQRQRERQKEQERRRTQRYYNDLERSRTEQIPKNPLYEYAIETVVDTQTGTCNEYTIQDILSRYASNGWRLHSIFTNEIGKTSNTVGYAGISGGINATVDQTVMVFERCIKPDGVVL